MDLRLLHLALAAAATTAPAKAAPDISGARRRQVFAPLIDPVLHRVAAVLPQQTGQRAGTTGQTMRRLKACRAN